MPRTFARALWIVSAATLALTGCDTKAEYQPAPAGATNQETAENRATIVETVPPADKPAPVAEATMKEEGESSGPTVHGATVGDEVGAMSSSDRGAASRAPRFEAKPKAGPATATATGLAGGGAAIGNYGLAIGASGKSNVRHALKRRPSRPRPTAQIVGFDDEGGNTEAYQNYGVNPMIATAEDHLSTFAIDVDTASYAIARRKILSGQLPPPASVRVEEFVNYFKYDYPAPTDGAPFAVYMDAAPSPLTDGRHILRVGVQGKKLSLRERKPANLVFLVDVSGSMSSPDKLDLAKRALRILVDNLKDGDTVAMVTYAGNTRVVLEPTGLEKKAEIVSALEDLNAGGSTAMASGIELAYQLAERNLAPNTVSRVIVLSDGDANVGKTSHAEILATIAGHVKEGVTLSTVGFGMGNYKDTMMEQLADKGNGNYAYIDSLSQAKRVFQEQLGGTLEVIAKDVKIQVDFDPEAVTKYRLVGYENRDIADRDFRNDKVDAGEIGAGHTVTAIYEVELAKASNRPLATVRIRAKKPRGHKATEQAFRFDRDRLAPSFAAASTDFRFATAVMATAELLRGSEHAKKWKVSQILRIARDANPDDRAERQEFVSLLEKLEPLAIATR